MRSARHWFHVVATAVCLFGVPAGASAQQLVDVCLKSGTHIRAAKIESRDGKFFLYPPGATTPLETPADQIKSVGVPCDPRAEPPRREASIEPVQRFGIHGSNTIGERLMPMIIDAFAQARHGNRSIPKILKPEEQEIEIRPSGAAQPVALIEFQAHGSGTSARGLLEKKAQIGMSSRQANKEETAKIAAQFNLDLLRPGNEHVLALDGLAVIVNADNPVRELPLETVARIFAGEITNWKDLRYTDGSGREIVGQDRPISVHARDDKSGTYDTFVSLVLNPGKRKLSPQAARYESSENLSDAVSNDAGGIGFIGLPYINRNHALGISSSCGLVSSPSKFTVKTEQYPLSRRLYLYTIGAPEAAVARELLQFAVSDAAQPTVIDAGFVDQAVEFLDATEQRRWAAALASNPTAALPPDKDIPGSVARDFESTLRSMRRSTVVFRFEYNRSDLDSKVVQDIGRLARYLQSPAAAGKRLLIVGYADAVGGWAYNQRLSTERAARVADELQRLGVRVPRDSIKGYSYMAPVACNESSEGFAKNRRVEIWIGQ